MYVFASFVFIAVLANNVICLHNSLCSDTKTDLEKTLTTTITKVIKGTGSKDDCLDPLSLPSIVGNFSNLQYTCHNSTMTGLKSCQVTRLKISPDVKTVEFVLDCSNFELSGDADFDGYFLYLPSKGCGGYSVCYGRHIITVYTQLNHACECGKDHIQFGDFSLHPESKGKSVYKFDNVFNGIEDVTSQRTEFANENCDDMVFFAQGPILYPVIQNLLLVCNKQLAKM